MDFCGKLLEKNKQQENKGEMRKSTWNGNFSRFIRKKFLDIVEWSVCTKFQVSNGCVTGIWYYGIFPQNFRPPHF